MNRNTKFDKNNSPYEIKILNRLRNGQTNVEKSKRYSQDTVDNLKEPIVDFIQSCMFRQHSCMVFELLGKDLYHDLKSNEFHGH